MNVLMMCAERILVYPQPVVVIGISPKSFGFYFFNNREKEGVDFLNHSTTTNHRESLRNILLPGTGIAILLG